MMTVAAYLPILIMILFTIVILAIIKVLKNRVHHYHQYIRGIFLGYLVILVIATGASFAFPYKEVKKEDEKNEIDLFNYFVGDRNWEELVPSYQQKQWEFPVPKKLNVTPHGGMVNVYIEKTNDVQNQVDIRYFQAPYLFNGVNIQQYIGDMLLPKVALQGEQLTIQNPKETEVTFYTLENELSFKQFNKESISTDAELQGGENVILIRVDKDVEVELTGDVSYLGE
ncbi:hypothetical protein [Virgibacillus pantothenticus]|uniref:hypothetical protein n=1 Tax=Virgibacillus pantothenticus TaxID=1473 RepID=UPI00098560B6|nr:hypothetical protein [Virgibacillus pantothenticus]